MFSYDSFMPCFYASFYGEDSYLAQWEGLTIGDVCEDETFVPQPGDCVFNTQVLANAVESVNPERLRVKPYLSQWSEMTVGDVVEEVPLEPGTIFNHAIYKQAVESVNPKWWVEPPLAAFTFDYAVKLINSMVVEDAALDWGYNTQINRCHQGKDVNTRQGKDVNTCQGKDIKPFYTWQGCLFPRLLTQR